MTSWSVDVRPRDSRPVPPSAFGAAALVFFAGFGLAVSVGSIFFR